MDLEPANFLKILGHDIRWRLLIALSSTDLRVQELVETVRQPQNLVSYHLGILEAHGFVQHRHSIADGREIYYVLDLPRISKYYRSVGFALHPALNDSDLITAQINQNPTARILFLCTHNSARSQMAEGFLRKLGGPNIDVKSAGTEPGEIHPFTRQVMLEMGIDISRQWAKAVSEYQGLSFDYVITVCDRAREVCPVFPGRPKRIHWSIPDPLAVATDPDQWALTFVQTAKEIHQRVGNFLMLLKSIQASIPEN
jgi:protein-tyrosine-phosphatase